MNHKLAALAILSAVTIGLLFIEQMHPEISGGFAISLAATQFREHWRGPWHETRFFFILLAAILIVTTATSIDPSRSIQGIRKVIAGLLLFIPFVVCGRLIHDKQPINNRLFFSVFSRVIIACSALLIVGYAASMLTAGVIYPLDLPALYGGWWRNQNYLGSQLGLNTILLIALGRHMNLERNYALIAYSIAAASFTLLLFLNVRGALLAVMLALPSALLSLSVWRYGIALITLAGSTCALIIGQLFPVELHQLLPFVFHDPNDLSNGRSGFFMNVLNATEQRPWLGWGFNTFKITEYALIIRSWGNEIHTHPHSVYLETLFSFGLLGSFTLMSGIFSIWKRTRPAHKSPLALLASSLLVYVLGRGLFDVQLADLEYPAAMAIILGLFMGAAWQQTHTSAPASAPETTEAP